MSPNHFNSWNTHSNEITVRTAGEFNNDWVENTTPGVRADFN